MHAAKKPVSGVAANASFEKMGRTVDSRFDGVDTGLKQIRDRLDTIETTLGEHTGQLTDIQSKVGIIPTLNENQLLLQTSLNTLLDHFGLPRPTLKS